MFKVISSPSFQVFQRLWMWNIFPFSWFQIIVIINKSNSWIFSSKTYVLLKNNWRKLCVVLLGQSIEQIKSFRCRFWLIRNKLKCWLTSYITEVQFWNSYGFGHCNFAGIGKIECVPMCANQSLVPRQHQFESLPFQFGVLHHNVQRID